MNVMRGMTASAAMAAGIALAGCYETAGEVVDRGVEIPVAAGTYRCVNVKDREPSTATVSAPARPIADDVVYLATIDKDRYAVRVAAMSGDLYLLEGRGNFRGAQHIFVQRLGPDSFALLVADTRSAESKQRLDTLARAQGLAIEMPAYGAPRINGPRDRQRAFLLVHTAAMLERTADCRRVP